MNVMMERLSGPQEGRAWSGELSVTRGGRWQLFRVRKETKNGGKKREKEGKKRKKGRKEEQEKSYEVARHHGYKHRLRSQSPEVWIPAP